MDCADETNGGNWLSTKLQKKLIGNYSRKFVVSFEKNYQKTSNKSINYILTPTKIKNKK
jgi:hypothetical protein